MANFDIEFDKLIFTEGGYVNDPDDTGGETYLGISRKHNPKWDGWKKIDSFKYISTIKKFNETLKKDESITESAKNLYKSNYWDKLMLDHVPSQEIAHQLFDDAVNRGVASAIRIAEHVMDMTVTGEFSDELFYNLCKYGKNK